jgi:proton-coupled amino acid transporter
MGKPGRRMVEASLFFSQVGLVCAYIAFICTSMVSIVHTTTGHSPSPWIFGAVLICIYIPLCLIRKIEVLAPTHLFADVMIVVTLLTLMVYACIRVHKNGGFSYVPAINGPTFLDAIGSSIYSYEGIGVVLPIYEVTKNPEKIAKNITAVITVVLGIYIAFGFLMLFAYGEALNGSPIITETITQIEAASHPGQHYVDYVILIMKVLFTLNLIFSFPLVLYPAHIIVEENLYKGWPKSPKRKWCKNLNRSILVICIVIVSILMASQLDKFLALLGALGCTPITFTLPTLFHLYICKPTGRER